MRILVTFLSRTSEGATTRRDKVFETETLTLGRGTDQTIHLRDPRAALEQATIVIRDERMILRGLTMTGVAVNGTMCRHAILKTGDKARIGQNVLTVLERTEGYDAALTFELDPEVNAEEAAPPEYKTRLSETGLRPRRWAWISAVLVLLVGLLIPVMVLMGDKPAEMLRNAPVPDDSIWLSGPLHNVHRAIAEDCQKCHTPFRRTPDHLCVDCHTDVQLHVPNQDGIALDEFSKRRCAECHKEHNEPATLIRRDQIVCTDCHKDIQKHAANTSLRNVSGFLVGHADFHVSMMSPVGDTDQYEVVRVALSADSTKENSGLKFPHAKHLAADGIKGSEGEVVLQCVDCHLPQNRGAVMRPINMERDCQRCHTLDFEPADPFRQVPHEQTDKVLRDLEEYYSWRYLYGLTDESELGLDPTVFRRPGKVDDRAARARVTQAAADKAMEVGHELVNRRSCVNCHEVRDTDIWPGFEVKPTLLTERWLPKGVFGHDDHSVGDCADCHAAKTSEDSSDVLIPDVYTCGDCHSGVDTADKITTYCIDCHGFHMEGAGQWSH